MAYNTGNSVPSTDAKDFIDNCENFDSAVNSLAATFQDRLGVTRSTLEGVVQGLSFFNVGTFAVGFTLTNSRQTLTYDGHEYGWSGVFPVGGKVVTAGSTPTPLGAGGWIDRSDVMLRSDLTGGGSLAHAYNVINVDLPPYNGDLSALIESVDSNTAILLGNRDYDLSGNPQFNGVKKNIALFGSGMPTYSSDGSRMEGGTRLLGNNKFGSCSGFAMYNLGLDCGSYVIDTLYGGTSKDGLSAIGDDQFFDNIRVLIKSNPAQPQHGIIFEGVRGVEHGFLETRGGYHGYVVKASDVTGGDVIVNATSGTTFIFKADNGKSYTNIHVNSVTHRGAVGLAPSGIFEAITNGTLTNVFIGKYVGRSVSSGGMFTKDATGTISDIHIDIFDVDGASSNGFSLANSDIGRVTIGTHKIKNCAGQGIYLDGGYSLNIGSGHIVNSGQNGYYFGGNLSRSNIQFGTIRADGCGQYGVKNDALIPINPGQVLGGSNASGLVSANFGDITVALGSGWTNDFFASKVKKIGRLVTLSGIVISAKTGSVIMTLPAHLRPAVTEVFSCPVSAPVASGAANMVRVFVQSDTGTVNIDSSAVSAVGAVVLSGISFFTAY